MQSADLQDVFPTGADTSSRINYRSHALSNAAHNKAESARSVRRGGLSHTLGPFSLTCFPRPKSTNEQLLLMYGAWCNLGLEYRAFGLMEAVTASNDLRGLQ